MLGTHLGYSLAVAETGALQAYPPEATDPLLGKVLSDRYRIVKKLGEGGMGAVYEGEHLVIKKRVAIKLLHPQFATSGDIVSRFHQEALAATAIGHEHIVEVNDMGRTPDGAIFMVLEFLAGTDFAGLLEKEPRLSVGRTVHIVKQVCDGLAAAHAKGIVHRDLKPENVFLVRRSSDPDFVKVLDFGISKFQDNSSSSGGRASTKTGAIMGTAYYMSPEQAQGKKSVDHRTDIWAIGVMLYKALSGRYPFDDDAYPMLIVKICTETPTPIGTLRPDVPEGLANAIDRCLTRDVDRRVQTCAELKALIEPFESLTAAPPRATMDAFAATMASDSRPQAIATPVNRDATQPAPSTPRASTAASGVRSSVVSPLPSSTPRWLPIAGVAVLASALAGGAVWAFGRTPEPPPTSFIVPPTETPPETMVAAGDPVEFIVSPSEAVVLIDGRPIAPNAEGRVVHAIDAEDLTLHELRTESQGFRTRIEDVRLSYAHRVVVVLSPGTGVEDERGTAPAPPPPTTSGRRPHSGGGAVSPPPTTTTTTGATAGSEGSGARGPRTGGGEASGGSVGSSGGSAPPPPTTVETAPPPPPTTQAVVVPPPPTMLKHIQIP